MLFLHAGVCAAFVAVGLVVLGPLVLSRRRSKNAGGLCGGRGREVRSRVAH